MWRLLLHAVIGLLLATGLPQSGHAQEPQKRAVRKAAVEALDTHYSARINHLKVRVRRVRGTVDTTTALRVRLSENEGSPTGLAQAQLQARRPDGEWESAGWTLLDVARLDSVVTIQGRVRGDEPIPVSKLETAWIETTDLRGEPIRVDAALSQARRGDLVAARYLQSDRVLRERDVRRPHAVDAGSSVRVVYRRGRLAFQVSCTAREPGMVDNEIRVRCADLETMYRVRVTSENTAEWIETL